MPFNRNNGAIGIGLGGQSETLSTFDMSRYVSYGESKFISLQLNEAEVVTINLDQSTDPKTLGRIQFRFKDAAGQDPNSLSIAYPINSWVKAYPVIHEVVYVVEFGARYYYFNPLNSSNYVNNNSIQGFSDNDAANVKIKSGNYSQTQKSQIPDSTSDKKPSLGKNFKDERLSVPILLPKEGDYILQGRFGNNIRFGSDEKTGAPNIKISLIDKRESKFNYAIESLDLNNSVWMTTDEPLVFKKTGLAINSKNNPPNTYDGKQIAIFSDRIIFNSKVNEIIMMSNKGIYATCNKNFSVDSGLSILLSASTSTILTSPKIYIGSESAKEPLVLGNKLMDEIISAMIDAIVKMTVPTPAGPSGPPINVSDFLTIKAKLKTALSKQNFTL